MKEPSRVVIVTACGWLGISLPLPQPAMANCGDRACSCCPSPITLPRYAPATTALVRVRVPSEAEVCITLDKMHVKTSSTGAYRFYRCGPLKPGVTYQYTIHARFSQPAPATENTTTENTTVEKQFKIRAGEYVVVELGG